MPITVLAATVGNQRTRRRSASNKMRSVPLMLEGGWRDLDTKGYLVARSFLGGAELRLLQEDYATGERPTSFLMGLKPFGPLTRRTLDRAVDSLLTEVRRNTALSVDVILKGYHFAAPFSQYGWHQDFDFLVQDLVNYLNLYIPIIKPSVEKTNLRLLPYDALKSRSKDAFRQLKSGEGRTLEPNGTTTLVHDIGSGTRFELALDIEEIAVTPTLAAGDLLMVRGDIVHRTQDAETPRVSTSVRVVDSHSLLHRDTLRQKVFGSVRRLHPEVQILQQCFEAHECDEIRMSDLIAFIETRVG